jgi:hypothetical protein
LYVTVDEQKRIWFVLSYMKEGLADTWQDDCIEKTTKDSTKKYKTWADMRQALEEEFKDVNSGKMPETAWPGYAKGTMM